MANTVFPFKNMAENKKSFLLYADLINIVKKLPKEVAGELFLIILQYVNDEDPIVDDLLLSIAFEPIKLQLKRDLVKYEDTKELKSLSGVIGNLKRWHIDLYQKFSNKEITIEQAISIAESRKTSHTDKKESQNIANIAVNVTDTVNDNVTVTIIKKDINVRKMEFSDTLTPFIEIYGNELINDFKEYWSEPNKSNSKFRMEMQKTWDVSRRLSTWAKNDKSFNKNNNQSTKFDRLVEANQQAPNPYLNQ